MPELDKKAASVFAGKVVRKDLVRKVKVVMDPISWTKKYPFLRWWAALKMIKESQCLKYARVPHPA